MEDSRDTIEKLYIDILGRTPDASGLETYTGILEGSDRSEALAEILHALITSDEFKSLKRQTLNEEDPPKSNTTKLKVNGLPVSHIVSFGTHCLTSYLLKKNNLKRYSLPFDWLFSSPETVLHCLSDKFETLMDEKYFVSVTHRRTSGEPGADHSYYRHHHNVHDMFAHRDPNTPSDYQYFAKSIKRFEQLLRSDEGKLFVMICRPDKNGHESFHMILEAIRQRTVNSALLCIQLKDPDIQNGTRSMRVRFDGGHGTLYDFTPSSNELGIGFDDPLDDKVIMDLIGSYDIDLKDLII